MAAAAGRAEQALRLAGASAAQAKTVGHAYPPAKQAQLEQAMWAAQEALGKPASTDAWAEGQAMTPDQAVAYALEHSPAGAPSAPEALERERWVA